MRSGDKIHIMNIAKDIVIAKLSASSPDSSNEASGKAIADMYRAIYDKVNEIYFEDNVDVE